MTKKLENIWECSRMIMPEYQQRIIHEEHEQHRQQEVKLRWSDEDWDKIGCCY